MSVQYRYVKSGDIYLFHESCKLKIDGKWIDGVIYFNANSTRQFFVRTMEDFTNSFEEIIDEGDL